MKRKEIFFFFNLILFVFQTEKIIGFLKNFYLQIMEDEYTLRRSPVIDKTKWIEKLKYDVLRFSLDSIDLNIVEIRSAVNMQVKKIYLFSIIFKFMLMMYNIEILRFSLNSRKLI